jgi:hypothetical protein
MELYTNLLINAFDVDIEKAFIGSVDLCKSMGVPEKEILCTIEDVDDFFMN